VRDAQLVITAVALVVACGVLSVCLVIGARNLKLWWETRPPRESAGDGERIGRAWTMWACTIVAWAAAAWIDQWAPKEELFAEISYGLDEVAGSLLSLSRVALGVLTACAVDMVLFPRMSLLGIVWPEEGPVTWADRPVALRAVALAGWIALYITIIVLVGIGGPIM